MSEGDEHRSPGLTPRTRKGSRWCLWPIIGLCLVAFGALAISSLRVRPEVASAAAPEQTRDSSRRMPRVLVTRDSRSSPISCRPRAVARFLDSFFIEVNRYRRVRLRKLFHESFEWFSLVDAFERFRTSNRTDLLAYFAKRHTQRERWRLRLVDIGRDPAGVGVHFVMQRTALDLPTGLGGAFRIAEGKGGITCPGKSTILVWSMGMDYAPGQRIPSTVAWSCPRPASWSKLNGPIIACVRA